MGPGVTLAVIGAILTFAVRTPPTAMVDWRIVGLIFMVAGGALIWHARRGTTRERVVTRVQGPVDPDAPASPTGPVIENPTAVREIIQERDFE